MVVFSEAVDPTSLNFSITPTPPRLNLTWSDNGTVLTITHGGLEEGTNYTFRVIYYRDLAGNVGGGAVSAFRSAEAAAEERGVVRGRVVNENGTPIGGARVEADTGEWTVTDENGNFTLELTPGHHTINIIVNGSVVKTVEVDVEAGGEEDMGEVEVSTEGGGGGGGAGGEGGEEKEKFPWIYLLLAIVILAALVLIVSQMAKRAEGEYEE